QLHSKRDSIPHVPVIYFCLPTTENLNRIAQDFQANLYDSFYLNFISAISRQNLEDLATAALQHNCVGNIHKVFDQYLNFICLEDDLFVLKNQGDEEINYYALNKCNIKDTEVEAIIDTTVDGLFSVFATLGSVPIIRCPKNNAAEMVAEKLNKKMYENLKDSRNNLFLSMGGGVSGSSGDFGLSSGGLGFHRPLLIILDRNVDMATPLHHTWTYQALAHDVLQMNLNRVTLPDNEGSGSSKQKKFDLNDSDLFWSQHKGSPFPTVAEAIQEELEALKQTEEEMKSIKNVMDDPSAGMSVNLNDNTARLSSAIQNLPQLLEKKRLIDSHTRVATSILDQIKARRLDTLFELEEKLMSRVALDRNISELLADEFGNTDDKLRLFLIYYICAHASSNARGMEGSEEMVERCLATLRDQGCDTSPYEYLRRWKQYNKISSPGSEGISGGGGSTIKTKSMFSKLVSQGSSFVMEGVKNLIVKKYNLPITKIVSDIYESHTGGSTSVDVSKTYKLFDPKLSPSVNTSYPSNPTLGSSNISSVVVFMLGAGNYIEYENLVQYGASSRKGSMGSGVKVIYATSALANASEFLTQLRQLGEEIKP
ncbi:hypothetical protein WDU94_003134, partial [Cyamophila willieti]